MTEENKERLEALECLLNSEGWNIVLQKASIVRDALYSKALVTEDSVLAKQYLEQMKGIEIVLRIPHAQLKDIEFQTKREESLNGE